MMVDGRQLPEPSRRADYLAQALTVKGGHLFIGGGGWFLHYAAGATLRGYELSVMKVRCVEAGLPVIDILRGDHKLPIPLHFVRPMVAVGRPPDQQPWCSSSYAPWNTSLRSVERLAPRSSTSRKEYYYVVSAAHA